MSTDLYNLSDQIHFLLNFLNKVLVLAYSFLQTKILYLYPIGSS
jgi:hypothetical protein